MQVKEFLQMHSQSSVSDSDEEEADFPPLGSRIQRVASGGSIMSQASMATGTVSKHFRNGMSVYIHN